MEKTLAAKLRRLQDDFACSDFILADAKDADMAFGLAATGPSPRENRFRTLAEYRDQIREIVSQGLIDVSLMSASTAELLAIEEQIFDQSPVTPAVRVNDSTDIWLAAGTGGYSQQPSLPIRSADIKKIITADQPDGPSGVQLGLYSITMNNEAVADRETLEAFRIFRREIETKNFQYFLEVFPPNAPGNFAPPNVGQFVCDTVVRSLAGLTRSERPLFLKLPYLGPELTESLVAYDTSLIVGIMGGAAGTTLDAFALLAEAKKYGARAALFGRRINQAEDQLAFVQHLRWIADEEIDAEEAVRSYHAELQRSATPPRRSLDDDLIRTSVELS